jgi:hypothetical protein
VAIATDLVELLAELYQASVDPWPNPASLTALKPHGRASGGITLTVPIAR